MPRFKKVFAWKAGNSFCASLMPKESGGAFNAYPTPTELLADAAARGLSVEWENPDEVDRWQA
jgi:hypothetical protein